MDITLCGKIKNERGAGRRPKYEYTSLEIGQTCVIPWPEPLGSDENQRPYLAMVRYSKRTGKLFRSEGKIAGLVVTRLK